MRMVQWRGDLGETGKRGATARGERGGVLGKGLASDEA